MAIDNMRQIQSPIQVLLSSKLVDDRNPATSVTVENVFKLDVDGFLH